MAKVCVSLWGSLGSARLAAQQAQQRGASSSTHWMGQARLGGGLRGGCGEWFRLRVVLGVPLTEGGGVGSDTGSVIGVGH